MIVLDTNVVSEPMKSNGSRSVQDWLDQQVAETLYLTATSLSELLVGVEILPDGKFHVKAEYLKNGEWTPGHEVTYQEAPGSKVVFK